MTDELEARTADGVTLRIDRVRAIGERRGVVVCLHAMMTDGRYFGARLPLGPLGLPLPVQVTHVVSKPLDLGDRKAALGDLDTFATLHQRVWDECQQFLDESVAIGHEHADGIDRATRKLSDVARGLGL